MTRRHEGRSVLLFGAGSIRGGLGNGNAAARVYAREGARVFAVDLHYAAAAATVEAITAEGGQAEAFQADVCDESQVAVAVKACVEQCGRIDVLHNNVGYGTAGGPEELSEAGWRRDIDINLTSMFLTCKHVLPQMVAQGGGAVVNISSIASSRWLGSAYLAYAAGKAGVDQLTRAIALQYARHNIRANVVAPGMIDTDLVRAEFEGVVADVAALMARRHAATPPGRMGSPWDVAHAASFLASDEARYVNGVVLPVDGGMTCQAVSPDAFA